MAGKPGRSGGHRPGAGRKPQEPPKVSVSGANDPKEFLLNVMNDAEGDARLRVDAAKALLPYLYPKVGEGGKKEERQNAAKNAGAGKFSAAPPPLRLVGGGK